MRRLLPLPFVLLALSIIGVSPAPATVVYINDFEISVGSEWSSTLTGTTPVGSRNFLGEFNNDAVSLSLSSLPEHNTVTIAFDLFVIRSWDGNELQSRGSGTQGPDVWELRADGSSLLRTTFSNIDRFDGAIFPQAYPGDTAFDSLTRTEVPGSRPGDTILASGPAGSNGNHPPRTGASEINTLGYDAGTGTDPMDSVYQISSTFSHVVPALTLDFSAELMVTGLLTGILDESWGLGNIVISVTSIPEPAAFALFSFGLVGVRLMSRAKAN